jgi:type VI secretion system secreted protein Hcp
MGRTASTCCCWAEPPHVGAVAAALAFSGGCGYCAATGTNRREHLGRAGTAKGVHMNNSRQRVFAAAIVAAWGLAVTPAMADSMFLKFTGDPLIVGDSVDARHSGEIDVDSYSVGIEADTSWTKGGGASVGKPNPGEFRFTAAMNSSVPMIMRYITTGKAAPTAVLVVRHDGSSKEALEYLKLTFTGAFFTKLGHGGFAGSEYSRPLSDISMVYKTVKMEYTPRRKDGSAGPVVCTLWDIPAGTSGAC